MRTSNDAWAQPSGLSIALVEEFQSRLAQRLARSPAWHDKVEACLGKQQNAVQEVRELTEGWIVSRVSEAWEWKDEVCYALRIWNVSTDSIGRTCRSRSKIPSF
ncbi:hypothetical protein AB1N83_012361 [Pleurotus pulmonarius]